jgi:hypothetical protein
MHFLCLWRQSHPIVFYTDAGMIRDELRGWNEEIKRLDRPIGQRARGLGGRLLKKKSRNQTERRHSLQYTLPLTALTRGAIAHITGSIRRFLK